VPGYIGSVTRRPTVPLLVALAGVIAFAVTGALALGSDTVHARDAAMLHGFVALDRPRIHDAFVRLTRFGDPGPYAALGLLLAFVALARGLRWRAGAVLALLVVTGACTQTFKQLLAEPRFEPWLGGHQIGEASWPSGHSTAAMTLALCAVLVAPPALRAVTAVLGGAFAAAVGYALLVLGHHFPSDVLGGFLMAGIWTALAVAGLRVVEPRPVAERTPARERLARLGLAVAAAVAVVAVAVAPRDELTLYASERPTLVVGALVIAALAAVLSAGFARAA
jgi:membrane-associated phospholipid phosphatase